MPTLCAYLADYRRWPRGHATAAATLAALAERDPEARPLIVNTRYTLLLPDQPIQPLARSAALHVLMDLCATEALPTIEATFRLGLIKARWCGSWKAVQRRKQLASF